MDEREFETHDIDADLADLTDAEDDAAEIRYSLTALGEAALGHDPRRGRGSRFRGFGPCVAVA